MNLYGYNARGEVTNAVRRWGNNPGNPGDVVAGQTFGYDYDPIGNRTWSKRGDYDREYAANELNQMTSSRGVPSVSHLLRLRQSSYGGQVGSADESATVTVNGQSVTRQDAYWYKDLAVTNDTAPQYPEVVIDATWSNILSSVTGNVFVAETPENFGYDDDGNMVSDGRFGYTWDGENRLIAVETLTNVVAASGAPQVRVEYAYDYIRLRADATTARQVSRRIRLRQGSYGGQVGKTVFNAYTKGAYATTNQTAYLYDGWNLISELTYSQTHTLTNFYTWGLDLSGFLQGAGGIGGLLSVTRHPALDTAFFTADANGNIGQLLDAANPTNILAHYEYSPFGETIVAVGELAKANPFRFSTKYHEDESGLVYYGYRYYNPDIGRWVNRDPIGERGGVNLFGFVGNNPIDHLDYLGQQIWIPNWLKQLARAMWMQVVDNYLSPSGYRVAEHLFVHSLQDNPSDLRLSLPHYIAQEMKASRDFSDHVDRIVADAPRGYSELSTRSPFDSMAFTQNRDLFLAVHRVGFSYDGYLCKISESSYYLNLDVTITDRYDFHLLISSYYNAGFTTTIANNMAWTDQFFGVIVPYDIEVSIKEIRLRLAGFGF